jgi:hypothetical protein
MRIEFSPRFHGRSVCENHSAGNARPKPFFSIIYDETGDGVETRLEFAADSFCEVPL